MNSIARIWSTATSVATSGQCARRDPAAIGARDVELVFVQVDRVIRHGKVAGLDAHAVALKYVQAANAREHLAVEGPEILVNMVLAFGV